MKKLFYFLFFIPTVIFSQNILSIDSSDVYVSDTLTVNVQITNYQSFVAFQTDIVIPNNFTYLNNSAVLTARANGHILSANLLSGNILRVLAFAINQLSFNGDTGSVMRFKIVAGDSVGLFSLELVNPIISNSNSQNILTGFSNGVVNVQEMLVSVELTTFSGRRTSGGIDLFWTTASETNNRGYSVERLYEGRQWETIGFVEGKGSSLTTGYYSFFDPVSTYQKLNTISYRIKQIDFSGECEYFNTISFSPESKPDGFELYANYPNPFNPSTIIPLYSANSSEIELTILDIKGDLIRKEKLSIPSGYSEFLWDGKNSKNIDVSAGIYLYSVKSKDSCLTKKMILFR